MLKRAFCKIENELAGKSKTLKFLLVLDFIDFSAGFNDIAQL